MPAAEYEGRRLTMDNTKKPVFIHSQELEKYSYPPDSMFVTQRAAKTRELLISLGLLEGKCGRESAPVPATESELKNFHTAKYLEALQQAAIGKITPEARSMGLGTPDCPVFKDMFDYASWACGATLTGAELITCSQRMTHEVSRPSKNL